jgi:hypothetical protein
MVIVDLTAIGQGQIDKQQREQRNQFQGQPPYLRAGAEEPGLRAQA